MCITLFAKKSNFMTLLKLNLLQLNPKWIKIFSFDETNKILLFIVFFFSFVLKTSFETEMFSWLNDALFSLGASWFSLPRWCFFLSHYRKLSFLIAGEHRSHISIDAVLLPTKKKQNKCTILLNACFCLEIIIIRI